MDRGTTLLVLANRSYLYSLLARGYAEEPDEAFLQMLAQEHARQEMALVEHELTADILAAFDELLEAICGDGFCERVRQEYVEVLVGPGTLKARPWETLHLGESRALFQQELLPVREAYHAAGFLPARYPHVQDDFVGLEFDFLAKLANAALAAWEAGDEILVEERLRQSRDFLEAHLFRWIDSLADSIAAEYGDRFYARFTHLAALVAHRDYDLLA